MVLTSGIRRQAKLFRFTYNVDDERGLPNNTINVFYEDDGGIMWIGTYKKGGAYYNESILSFPSTAWETSIAWKSVVTVVYGWAVMTPD